MLILCGQTCGLAVGFFAVSLKWNALKRCKLELFAIDAVHQEAHHTAHVLNSINGGGLKNYTHSGLYISSMNSTLCFSILLFFAFVYTESHRDVRDPTSMDKLVIFFSDLGQQTHI